MTVRAAILGGGGYGAGELLRLLVQHPHAEVTAVATTSHAGAPIDAVHPHLCGFYRELRMTGGVDLAQLLDADEAVVFSALPHGASAAALDALLALAAEHAHGARMRAIDLSGDLRLRNAELHERHYPHTQWLAERRAAFAYGLPELNGEAIRGARCIANPGCLASASILAVAPLVDASFAGSVVIDAKTGSSGSGRTLKETTHHPTRRANFRAYRPLGHQHEPEILQALGDAAGERLRLSFVPQSMDTTRGIYVTAHLELPAAADTNEVLRRYEDYYADAPFVRIVDATPELQNVVGSNFCDIGVAARGRQVVAMAALDNLIKGMCGTAIQNMNLMCGWKETTGLWAPALRPM